MSKSKKETIYLSSIPGMVESLIEGKNTPIEECVERIDFWPEKAAQSEELEDEDKDLMNLQNDWDEEGWGW